MTPALTVVQQRYLDEIHQDTDGVRAYNGRAIRPLRALEQAGLVEVDWDMRAQSKGSGIELVWHLRARLTASGRALYSD